MVSSSNRDANKGSSPDAMESQLSPLAIGGFRRYGVSKCKETSYGAIDRAGMVSGLHENNDIYMYGSVDTAARRLCACSASPKDVKESPSDSVGYFQ